MPNNKYLLILGFMLIVNASHSQRVFEKNLDNYVSYINKNVLKFIYTNKRYAQYNKCIKKGRYLIVPRCGFDGINILTSTNYFDLLRIDTSFINYRIEYVNDSLNIVPNLYGENQYLDTNVVQLQDFPRSVFYTLYQQAREYSTYCFALKLRDGADPAANFLVAYIEGNGIKVIGTNEILWPVKYNSIEEYIVAKWGSVKNYADMCKSDALLRKENSLTATECKQRLKQSYFYFGKYLLK